MQLRAIGWKISVFSIQINQVCGTGSAPWSLSAPLSLTMRLLLKEITQYPPTTKAILLWKKSWCCFRVTVRCSKWSNLVSTVQFWIPTFSTGFREHVCRQYLGVKKQSITKQRKIGVVGTNDNKNQRKKQGESIPHTIHRSSKTEAQIAPWTTFGPCLNQSTVIGEFDSPAKIFVIVEVALLCALAVKVENITFVST